MDNSGASSLLPFCRLCGALGQHKIDVFDGKSRPGASIANALRDNIFRCVDVRIERDDETTKVCEYCFSQIHTFVVFRKICAATDRKLQMSKSGRIETSGDVINELIQTREASVGNVKSFCRPVSRGLIPLSDPFVECFALIDDETESENDEEDPLPAMTAEKQFAQNQVKGGPECIANRNDKHSTEDSASMDCDGDEWLAADGETQSDNQSATNSTCGQNPIVAVQNVETNHAPDEFLQDMIDLTGPCEPTMEGNEDSDAEFIDARIQNVDEYKGNFFIGTNEGGKNKRTMKGSKILIKCKGPGRCEESFGSWDGMMYHVATYHARGVKRTYCCHLCKKTSTTKHHLKEHMNALHSRETRFICPIRRCAKIFTLKCNLVQHTNAVHTKRVAFECTKCPMKFYRKFSLTRHLANKHGVGMTFSCYLCKKTSCDKHALQMHMNSLHTGQLRIMCPFPMCSKFFSRKGNLNQHTNAIHTKKNVFKCTECDKEFYYKQSLNQHIANMH